MFQFIYFFFSVSFFFFFGILIMFVSLPKKKPAGLIFRIYSIPNQNEIKLVAMLKVTGWFLLNAIISFLFRFLYSTSVILVFMYRYTFFISSLYSFFLLCFVCFWLLCVLLFVVVVIGKRWSCLSFQPLLFLTYFSWFFPSIWLLLKNQKKKKKEHTKRNSNLKTNTGKAY